jgi:hypothetical protein
VSGPEEGLLPDLFARDDFTWAIRQVQGLGDHEQEVGLALQFDATHPKLCDIGKVANSFLEQGSITIAGHGAESGE